MSKLNVLCILVAAIALSGCGPDTSDLESYVANVKATTQPSVEPYPTFTSQPAFSYSAQTLRSPFERPKEKTRPTIVAKQVDCDQPDFQRDKQPLEQYGIDALRYSGKFDINGATYALFRTNDGLLHRASIGSRLGLFYGTIKAINAKSVVVEELKPDGAGCWQREENTIAMLSTAGE